MNRKSRAIANLEQLIHDAEMRLFRGAGVEVDEYFLDLAQTRLRVRVLSHGNGRPRSCYMARRSAPQRGRHCSQASAIEGYSPWTYQATVYLSRPSSDQGRCASTRGD